MIVRISLTISVLAAAVLSGCAMSEDTAGRFMVQPEKYVLYNCRELAEAAYAIRARQLELERLMVKAGSGTGELVSDLAYRPEYVQLRGQMNELRRTSAEKNCQSSPAVSAGSQGSDQFIR